MLPFLFALELPVLIDFNVQFVVFTAHPPPTGSQSKPSDEERESSRLPGHAPGCSQDGTVELGLALAPMVLSDEPAVDVAHFHKALAYFCFLRGISDSREVILCQRFPLLSIQACDGSILRGGFTEFGEQDEAKLRVLLFVSEKRDKCKLRYATFVKNINDILLGDRVEELVAVFIRIFSMSFLTFLSA